MALETQSQKISKSNVSDYHDTTDGGHSFQRLYHFILLKQSMILHIQRQALALERGGGCTTVCD